MAAQAQATLSKQTIARRYLRRSELEQLTGIRKRTWDRWALMGTGPKYRLVGGLALYALEDVERWIEQCPEAGGR